MRKMTLLLILAVSAVPFTPRTVAAQDCTDGYVKCLNDSHDKSGWIQKMADIECFTKYLRCASTF